MEVLFGITVFVGTFIKMYIDIRKLKKEVKELKESKNEPLTLSNELAKRKR